jgi:hypothetical protein
VTAGAPASTRQATTQPASAPSQSADASSNGSDGAEGSPLSTPSAVAQQANAAGTFATAAAAAAAAVPGVRTQPAAAESILGPRTTNVAEAADRLMNQVVRTIRTFDTSAGPSVEARVSDPNLGDVRVVVTGRAGEIVQAQLVVRDRAAADAIAQAAARIHSTSDGLAGVSLTVRSEDAGTASGGRPGGGFDAADWSAGTGYGSGAGAHGSGNQAGNQQGAGTGGLASGGDGSGGSQTSHDAPNATPRIARVIQPQQPVPGRSLRSPLPGGSSVDIRA